MKLALPLAEDEVVPCRGCGAPVDAFGDHALGCSKLGVYARHNIVRNAFAELLRDFGHNVSLENQLPNSRDRPADVLLSSFGDSPVALDASVVHVLHSDISSAARDGSRPVVHREKAKQRLYADRCRQAGWAFVPCVATTLGRWGGAARGFVNQVIKDRALLTGEDFDEVAESAWTRLTVPVVATVAKQLSRAFPEKACTGPVLGTPAKISGAAAEPVVTRVRSLRQTLYRWTRRKVSLLTFRSG